MLCLAAGGFFFFLSALFLPILALKPRKFVLLFTMGSVMVVVGLGLLKGFPSLYAHVTSSERLPFASAYAGSLLATLYGAIVMRSVLATVFFGGVQVVSLAYFAASYVPGGTASLSIAGRSIRGAAQQGLASLV